jgi:hypothetical protein
MIKLTGTIVQLLKGCRMAALRATNEQVLIHLRVTGYITQWGDVN